MKKLLIAGVMGLGLAGCVSPATQMIDNKFLDVQVSAPEVAGTWTAAVGGGLSTIRLNQDGMGVMCEDNGSRVNVYKLRNSSNFIYAQNGMSLKKITINNQLLNVKTTFSSFNVDMKYRTDNELKLATSRCAQEIR